MDKQTQDLAWACLPKEVRKEIKYEYQHSSSGSYMEDFLENTFGKHNLTSDTDPEEMLMVERKKVQEYKADIEYTLAGSFSSEYSKGYWRGQQTALDRLFNDKCLPDKELEHRLEQPSVQVEPKPKFDVGKFVYIPKLNKTGVIQSIQQMNGFFIYGLVEMGLFSESDLEPYTEPESRNLSQEIANCDKSEDNQLKDNMEEKELGKEDDFPTKELNLCELLKGCEKEKFYSPMLGDAFIVQIRETSIHIVPCDEEHSERFLFIDKCGIWTKGGQCILYPSCALYEKYPLDACSAWMEWKESRKPKRWRAKKGDNYWYIDSSCGVTIATEEGCYTDDYRHKIGNYFMTKFDAVTAYGLVKSAFKRFHEK